jgi:predicted GNAT family acetyltransferase
LFAVQNNTELQRYEIFEAGNRIGFVQYQMHHEQMWVLFTQMRRKFKSASRAHRVMALILEDARRGRIRVVPFCPAFRVFLYQNPAAQTLVPQEWQQRITKAINEEQENADNAVLKYIRYTGSPWRKSTARPMSTLAA